MPEIKRKLYRFSVLVGCLMLIVAFQNFGETVNGRSIVFNKGDKYLPENFPCTPTPATKKWITLYRAISSQAKALAFSRNCATVVISDNLSNSQGQLEASKNAMEQCQLQSGDQECVLLAENFTVKTASADLETSFARVIPKQGEAFDYARIPFIELRSRTTINGLMGNVGTDVRKSYGSLALRTDGNWAIGWAETSVAEADRVALQRCEGNSLGKTCTVFSRASGDGHVIAFNGATGLKFNPTSAIDYANRVFDIDKIPFLEDSQRTLVAANWAPRANMHYALVIAPTGAYGIAAHANALSAKASALVTCKQNNSAKEATLPCFYYADDTNVVMDKGSITHIQGDQ